MNSLLQKTGPSEETICSYLFAHPLKLRSFAPSTSGLKCLEWPRGINKSTRSRRSRCRMATLMWVVQNELWIQADHGYFACFWPGLLHTSSQPTAFSGHELFQVGSCLILCPFLESLYGWCWSSVQPPEVSVSFSLCSDTSLYPAWKVPSHSLSTAYSGEHQIVCVFWF